MNILHNFTCIIDCFKQPTNNKKSVKITNNFLIILFHFFVTEPRAKIYMKILAIITLHIIIVLINYHQNKVYCMIYGVYNLGHLVKINLSNLLFKLMRFFS